MLKKKSNVHLSCLLFIHKTFVNSNKNILHTLLYETVDAYLYFFFLVVGGEFVYFASVVVSAFVLTSAVVLVADGVDAAAGSLNAFIHPLSTKKS